MSDYYDDGADAPVSDTMTYSRHRRASITDALTLGVPGRDADANARRAAAAEAVLAEFSNRQDIAYARENGSSYEPNVPEPFAARLVAQQGGDLAAVVQHRDFAFQVNRKLDALPVDEYVSNEDGEGWQTTQPTAAASEQAATEVARLRDVFTRQYTLASAQTRLLELEYDVANETSTEGRALALGEARNIIKSTTLGQDEGPALEDAAKNLDQTAGRYGMTVDLQSSAHEQSLYASWGTFERNPFEQWESFSLNEDVAYFAEGARVDRGDLATMTSEQRRDEVADVTTRMDTWSRDGVHSALTGAASVVSRYESYPEADALVADARALYETVRTVPGAPSELKSIDQVLAAAKSAQDEPEQEQSSTRDRIRENFAAQREGITPAGTEDLRQRMTAAFQQGLQDRQDRAERGASTVDAVQARAADRVRDIGLAETTAQRLVDSVPDMTRTTEEHAVTGHEAADLETMARLHGKWGGADPVIADRVGMVDARLSETTTRPSISDVDAASYAGYDKRSLDGWQNVQRQELANNTAEQKVVMQATSAQQQSSVSFPRSAAADLNASMGQAQPAPTFRSGRGFGAATKDVGVER